jgi:hypothetical protein
MIIEYIVLPCVKILVTCSILPSYQISQRRRLEGFSTENEPSKTNMDKCISGYFSYPNPTEIRSIAMISSRGKLTEFASRSSSLIAQLGRKSAAFWEQDLPRPRRCSAHAVVVLCERITQKTVCIIMSFYPPSLYIYHPQWKHSELGIPVTP